MNTGKTNSVIKLQKITIRGNSSNAQLKGQSFSIKAMQSRIIYCQSATETITEPKVCVILQYLHKNHGSIQQNSVNKCICISNESFPKAVNSIDGLSLSYI